MAKALVFASALLVAATPAFAQFELTGSYAPRLYEDYIERGPGSDLGDYSGMPLTDDGRSKALLYTSNLPSTMERQCLAQSAGVFQYRPRGLKIWPETDEAGRVIAWILGGDNLRGEMKIWMDGRPHPSPNAMHTTGGFTTGTWQGDTLTTRTTHVKTAWIRRGVGIPGSDQSTFTSYITRHDNFLTVTTIQQDPVYLTEPHVVSRVWEYDPRGDQTEEGICVTANEIPRLQDTGIVPHYLPGQNPEADHMIRNYKLPREAAMGYAESLYPEYRKKIRSTYTPPTACDRYCCGWIERQGLPGGAPNLTCNDGGFKQLIPGRKPTTASSSQ
jgi:hypothetical protein